MRARVQADPSSCAAACACASAASDGAASTRLLPLAHAFLTHIDSAIARAHVCSVACCSAVLAQLAALLTSCCRQACNALEGAQAPSSAAPAVSSSSAISWDEVRLRRPSSPALLLLLPGVFTSPPSQRSGDRGLITLLLLPALPCVPLLFLCANRRPLLICTGAAMLCRPSACWCVRHRTKQPRRAQVARRCCARAWWHSIHPIAGGRARRHRDAMTAAGTAELLQQAEQVLACCVLVEGPPTGQQAAAEGLACVLAVQHAADVGSTSAGAARLAAAASDSADSGLLTLCCELTRWRALRTDVAS